MSDDAVEHEWPALAWREFGTGFEARVGPLRLAVYCRGDWVTECVWLGRGHGSFWQEWRSSKELAKLAAATKAIEWLRAEREQLDEALGTLGQEVAR